jgi:uncharacterized membrane protein YcaP (DUF421 family)
MKIDWKLYWKINAVVFLMVLLVAFFGKLNMNSMVIFSCVLGIGAAQVYISIRKAIEEKQQEEKLSPWN